MTDIAFIRALLEDEASKTAEVLSWLESNDRKNSLGELPTNEDSIKLVREAYAAGAEEIIAVEIDEYPDGYENTGRIVVKLPSNEAARKRVVEWCAKQAQANGFDGEDDHGQAYIFVMLD